MKTLLPAVVLLALAFPTLAQEPPAATIAGEIEASFTKVAENSNAENLLVIRS